MMHTRAYIINITLCLGGLLFASCGKQYTAEQTVKDFVAENMQDGVETSGVDFADLGTLTTHLWQKCEKMVQPCSKAAFSMLKHPLAICSI